jgi:hypothetical protein
MNAKGSPTQPRDVLSQIFSLFNFRDVAGLGVGVIVFVLLIVVAIA